MAAGGASTGPCHGSPTPVVRSERTARGWCKRIGYVQHVGGGVLRWAADGFGAKRRDRLSCQSPVAGEN